MFSSIANAIRNLFFAAALSAASLTAPVLELGCSSSDSGCGDPCSSDDDCNDGARCLSFGGSADKTCMPSSCADCSSGCKYDESKCEFDSCY